MESTRVWVGGLVALTVVLFGVILAANSKNPAAVTPASITADQATILTVRDTDHVRGNPAAPVTLIEYGDFQCPGCGAVEPLLQQLVTEHGQSVRLVYRHFPLSRHAYAELMARAAEAADRQGRFYDLHDRLFAEQARWSSARDARELVVQYARDLGLNIDQFERDLADGGISARIANDEGEAAALKLPGTPSFFLNGQVLAMPRTYDDLVAAVEAAQPTPAP
jgi:protein-disulfide isomerase